MGPVLYSIALENSDLDYNSHVPSPIGGKIILQLHLIPHVQINPELKNEMWKMKL